MTDRGKENLEAVAGKLLALLQAMAGCLDDLYTCFRDQQKALMTWRVADFVATTKRQRTLVQENLDREKQRRELVSSLVGVHRAAEMSLRDVAELFGGKWPEKFREISGRLRESSSRVAIMKKHNEALIANGRNLVDSQVKLLMDLASLNRNTYTKSGRKAKQKSLHQVLDGQA